MGFVGSESPPRVPAYLVCQSIYILSSKPPPAALGAGGDEKREFVSQVANNAAQRADQRKGIPVPTKNHQPANGLVRCD